MAVLRTILRTVFLGGIFLLPVLIQRIRDLRQPVLNLQIVQTYLTATGLERAKTVGYPERFAQQALGHNSKAVHHGGYTP
ncbi:MAG: hypothetical protein ABSD57_03005 [Verrucomicrobiota bacterium]|jgi:hypothetical protein